MDKIKFRQYIDGNWHYWGYIKDYMSVGPIEVNGDYPISYQFIGMKSPSGIEIFEGDIIEQGHIGKIIWNGEGVITKCPIGVVEYQFFCS